LTIILRLQIALRGSRPEGESSMSFGGDMTPPGLELNQSWTHRSCGASRSRNIRAVSALRRRHSKLAKRGSRQAPPFWFCQLVLAWTVAMPAMTAAMPSIVSVVRWSRVGRWWLAVAGRWS